RAPLLANNHELNEEENVSGEGESGLLDDPIARFIIASKPLAVLWLLPALYLTLSLQSFSADTPSISLWVLFFIATSSMALISLKTINVNAWLSDVMLIQACISLVSTVFFFMLKEYYASGFFIWAFLLSSASSHSLSQPKSFHPHPTSLVSSIKRAIILVFGIAGNMCIPLLMMHGLSRLALQAEYPPQGVFIATPFSPQVLIECQGAGSPTVVFETGLGALRHDSFGKLFEAVKSKTRVCWYDRPGYVYSHALVDHPLQTTQVVSDNLWQVLQDAREYGPFVVVGHSIAGLYLRNFVMDHARNVSGLMLLDTSSEYQGAFTKAGAEETLATIGNLVSPLIPSATTYFGLFGGGGGNDSASIGEESVHALNDAWMKTMISELRGSLFDGNPEAFMKKRDDLANGSEDGLLFGDLPVTLITAGNGAAGVCKYFKIETCTQLEDLPKKGKVVSKDGKKITYVNNTIPKGWGTGWLGWHHQQVSESSDNVWEIFVNGTHFVMKDYSEETLSSLEGLIGRARVYWQRVKVEFNV
ncbi:UNVERIFIED_CONTAM: hypothetical protein HDU68_000840, partial [Siphonaria sp. JEL0065]